MTDGSLTVLPVYRRGDLRTLRYGLLEPAIVADELTVAKAAQATVAMHVA
jgi:hypothetical protein